MTSRNAPTKNPETKYPKTQSSTCPICTHTMKVSGHTHDWRVKTAAMMNEWGCGPCSRGRKLAGGVKKPRRR